MPNVRSLLILVFATACLNAFAMPLAADDRTDLEAAYSAGDKARTASDFPTAARFYERALAIAPRVWAANSSDMAVLLIDLAGAYRDSGQAAKAEPLLLRSLKIRESKSLTDPDVAESLDALGALFLKMGRYSDAEKQFSRSLKIRESKLPAGDLKIAKSAHGLAVARYWLGNYPGAEVDYLRVLQIRETKLGKDDPQLAGPLSDLAALYQAMGQLEKSDQLYQRALKIHELKLGPNDLKVAVVLNNRAALLFQTKHYAEAKQLLQRSLKIRESKLGLNHPDLTPTINNLGNVFQALGQLDDAEKFLQRAIQIAEAKLGRDHPVTANHVGNLGSLLTMMGQYQKAEPLLKRSVKSREEQLGADHPDVGLSRVLLAELHKLAGQPREAAIDFDQQRRSARRHIAYVLPALSPAEQLAFLQHSDRANLETALTLGIDSADDAAICELSAGWLANGKAVAQQTLAELTALSRDPSLVKTVSALTAVQKQLATLTFASYDPTQTASRLKKLAELTAQEQELSKQLQLAASPTATSEPKVAARNDPWIEIAAVRQALPADTMLVDIARIQPTNWAAKNRKDSVKPAHYAAWIVPPTADRPVVVVDLGLAEAIDAAVAEYQTAIALAQSGKPIKELGEAEALHLLQVPLSKLSGLILEPMRKHLDTTKNLVICPDSALWLVPWTALPIEENQFAIEKWNIRFVTSGRELVTEQRATTKTPVGSPRIFANPNYDLTPREAQEALDAVLQIGPAKTPIAQDSGSATAKHSTGSLATIGRVSALAGTAGEAQAVAPKLAVYAKAQPKLYLENQAQEGVFRRMRSPQVLLISTHGFFLPAPEPKRDGDSADYGGAPVPTAAPQAPAENLLVRCGLLLAGCNKRDSIPASSKLDDGVLTGMEIVGTDLRGTELVVLSACETGIGKVNSGEGVAGLRQAFQLAGAQSVVATLWQIPDQATAQLMNDFFANLAAGQSKSEALRNAQLTRIKARREKYGAAHPLYWAAFTLTGK